MIHKYETQNDQHVKLIFSGGTGRSGTTIIGRLLSRHSQVTMSKPAEIKFLTSGNGILDLYSGRKVGRYRKLLFTEKLHLERFRYRLFHEWWEREAKDGSRAGLVQGIERKELNELFESLKNTFEYDKTIALQSFLYGFVRIQSNNANKPLWIDTTPINMFRSNEITNLLPEARFIHIIRDGRDVIASVIRERWGPKTYDEGLVWYRKRMLKNISNSLLLGNKVLTISLENLVIHKRNKTLHSILDFLNLKSENAFETFFNEVMLESSISRNRWEKEVKDVNKFTETYADLVDEFRALDPNLPLEI